MNSRVEMQGISSFKNIYMLTDSHLDFTAQNVNKFFALVMVTDTLMILLRFDTHQKCFEVLIFSTGRQGRIGVIFRSLGMGLNAAFQLGFRLLEKRTRVNLQRSGNLQKSPDRRNGFTGLDIL